MTKEKFAFSVCGDCELLPGTAYCNRKMDAYSSLVLAFVCVLYYCFKFPGLCFKFSLPQCGLKILQLKILDDDRKQAVSF